MYFAVFVKNLKQQLMYRSEFLLNIIGNLLSIYVQISIWSALLAKEFSGASNIALNQMITYIVVSYLLRRASTTYFTSAFADKINRGDIAVDLIRPVSMKNVMFSEQISENLCTILFSCVPVAIVCGLIWGIEFIISGAQLLLFLVSIFFAIALQFYIEYICGVCVFWARSDAYMRQILSGFINIFSGRTIPLWFYPGWLAAIGKFLPFRLMSFEPIQIFMGQVDIVGARNILLQQLLWLVLLYALERFIWSKLRYNIFVQGG